MKISAYIFVILFGFAVLANANDANIKTNGDTVRLRDNTPLTLNNNKSHWKDVPERFKSYKVTTGEWDRQNEVSYRVTKPGLVYVMTDYVARSILQKDGWLEVDELTAVIYRENGEIVKRPVYIFAKEHVEGKYDLSGGRYMIGIRMLFK